MNITKAFAVGSFATCLALALTVAGSKEAEARTVFGNIAGFQGVTAIDRDDVDSLFVPLTRGTGEVHVRCSTGDITFNGYLGRPAARAIAKAWCY